MSDTMLRSSYAQIYSEMEEFQRWIGFAAVMHEGMIDYQNAERLQKHLNIILEYVGNGRTLPFEKLTTLCDVAGSLQPVVSLIRKNICRWLKMPINKIFKIIKFRSSKPWV